MIILFIVLSMILMLYLFGADGLKFIVLASLGMILTPGMFYCLVLLYGVLYK